MKKAIVSLLALVLASLALLACGGGSDNTDTGATPAPAQTGGGGGGGGGGQNLTVTADPSGQLSWSPTELSAKAGQVTITLDNPAPIQHDVTLQGNGVDQKSELVSQGTASVTANLKPGTYEYFCSVPGHKEAGMDGTLTVK
jgi:plastocyanin